MIYKCPSCNGALEYNPASDKMECAYCENDYFVWELEEAEVEPAYESADLKNDINKSADVTKEHTIYDEPELMECKIYTCTSCGAELAVSDTEVSTYCAYCGQPTIVYSRVSKEQKPKYIIPFKVTKEDAEKAIRNKLRKGFLIPRKIKKFEAEKITGIYLPYYFFDVYYYDKQKRNNGDIMTIEADCEFVQVSFDASKVVSDELSQALDPYDLRELKEFEAGYLSGFYADRYDLTARQLTNAVVRRCKQMFDDELSRRFERKLDEIIESHPDYEIRKAEYAFLPVWFLTFRYKDKPCTMMVNGQTGKVVGTVPFQKAKIITIFILLAVLFSSLFAIVGCVGLRMFSMALDSMASIFWLIWFGCLCLLFVARWSWKKANKNFKEIKTSLRHTQLKKAERFMMERQEKNL